MSVDLTAVHPTRLELLRLKRRRGIAQGIVDILKKDYDTLVMALFDLVRQVPSLRSKMRDTLAEAYTSFIEAQMIVGSRMIEEVSLVCEPVDLDIESSVGKKVLGLELPVLQFTEKTVTHNPRFNILDTPAKLDESNQKIVEALDYIIKLAEAEASMKEILDVMSVKKRQINRIQYKVLPQLDASIRYVELILEETERQDAIRVRVLQRKRKERAQKTVQISA
ncbi:V-type ATP synthase subunit D [Candidatus Bathyarchaeota archaeon]|nr:V-type ATP synthase subunit D [Candidatus Bathyarchaeota archaeon]